VGASERQAAVVAACLSLLAAPANAAPSLDRVVSRAVRSNYQALHGCYRKVLAEDRRRGGTVFVRVTLGPHDAVRTARVERDKLQHAEAVACILSWVRGWTLPGAAAAGAGPGSDITIPLTFRSMPDQFLVRADDARAVQAGPLAARLLLHERNSGARRVSLVQLATKGPASLPAVDSEQLLYVLSGAGRLAWRRGSRRVAAGMAARVPAGWELRLEGTLELLQAFMPAGPERRYLGQADRGARGRRRAQPPVVVSPRKPRSVGPEEQRARVETLFDPRRRGGTFTSAVLELAAGFHPRDPAFAQLLYVISAASGAGSARVGSATEDLEPGAALYFPEKAAGGVRVRSGRVRALQILLPPQGKKKGKR
jgi:mannose-6-phosphate isomerase-like protein (cupin superfamily)